MRACTSAVDGTWPRRLPGGGATPAPALTCSFSLDTSSFSTSSSVLPVFWAITASRGLAAAKGVLRAAARAAAGGGGEGGAWVRAPWGAGGARIARNRACCDRWQCWPRGAAAAIEQAACTCSQAAAQRPGSSIADSPAPGKGPQAGRAAPLHSPPCSGWACRSASRRLASSSLRGLSTRRLRCGAGAAIGALGRGGDGIHSRGRVGRAGRGVGGGTRVNWAHRVSGARDRPLAAPQRAPRQQAPHQNARLRAGQPSSHCGSPPPTADHALRPRWGRLAGAHPPHSAAPWRSWRCVAGHLRRLLDAGRGPGDAEHQAVRPRGRALSPTSPPSTPSSAGPASCGPPSCWPCSAIGAPCRGRWPRGGGGVPPAACRRLAGVCALARLPCAHRTASCLTHPRRQPGQEYPPFTAYWKAAVTNCVGPACGLQALKYISYPAQARPLSPWQAVWGACGTACCMLRCSGGQADTSGRVLARRPPPHLTSPDHALHPPTHTTHTAPGAGQVVQNDPRDDNWAACCTGKRYSVLEYACCLTISGAGARRV